MPYRRRYGNAYRRANRYRGRRRYNGGAALSVRNGYIPPSMRGYVRSTGFYGKFNGYDKEYKFLDIHYPEPFTAIGSGGWSASLCLNVIPEGTGPSERTGRRVIIHGFSMNLMVHSDSEYQAVSSPVAQHWDVPAMRIAVVVDTQNNGALTTNALDVFHLNNSSSFPNLLNKNRFRFILDKTFTVPTPSISTDGVSVMTNGTQRQYSFRKAMRIPIEFSGTTGAQSEVRSNNIFVIWTVLDKSINATWPAVSGYEMLTRIRYSDA